MAPKTNKKAFLSIEEAVLNRQKNGFRFDNSAYWRDYYMRKVVAQDFKREERYASFLMTLLKKECEVLDVATGYGFLPLELFRKKFKVTCLDRYEKMIRLAKEYFALHGAENIEIVKSDVVKMPFKDKSFCGLTAMSILEHLPEDEAYRKFFPEICRVVKDDGWLLIHVPVKSRVTRAKRFYRMNIIGDLREWAIDDDGDVTHKMWKTTKEYMEMIDNNGLKVNYIGYNFSRSNEKMWFMKIASWFLSKMDGEITKVEKGTLSKKQDFLSKFATSAVYFCQKA